MSGLYVTGIIRKPRAQYGFFQVCLFDAQKFLLNFTQLGKHEGQWPAT